MKRTTLTILMCCLVVLSFGQKSINQKMIELGKAYKDFMFRNDPSKEVIKELKQDVPDNLKVATNFVIQTITKNNKILTSKFLTRPDDIVLKQIYIIRAINLNLREENQIENNKLIDSLSNKEIPIYELVDNYYEMIFGSAGNKNQPVDLSNVDLKLKEYNLKDDTEKGILVLKAISFCGTTIWGFINIPKPANTKKAYQQIKKFPKINGRPYYQYTDFYFTDFEMIIIVNKGIQSYKSYYIDKYYETLLNHLLCLYKEGGSEKDINDLLLGSILKEENLYKYTKHQQTLKDLFKKMDKD